MSVMKHRKRSVVVVGAGIFGLAGAVALAKRGFDVTAVDPGPVPHPSAASNDVSRMVRMDYGSDRLYTRLAAESIEGWRRWNARWGRDLYHQDGLVFLSSRPVEEGGYEEQSYQTLTGEGWPLERLSSASIASRFPVWNSDYYINGYFNPQGGWAEARSVTSLMARDARMAGVEVITGFTARSIMKEADRAVGVVAEEGAVVRAGEVVVAAGAWTPTLLPELDGFLRLSGQPALYFKPSDPRPFEAGRFPPWGADLALSGLHGLPWGRYGFPANREGIVKVGLHGPGYPVSPDAPRVLPGNADEMACRKFLSHSLPSLADAPLAHSKMCVYTDTWDGNFLISRHPETSGLTVATGGSGHGFKFAPALGGLVADAVQGVDTPYSDRFAWRPIGRTNHPRRHRHRTVDGETLPHST